MPVKATVKALCTKVSLKVAIRANLGNYEDLVLEAQEEYSLAAGASVEDTRSILMSNLQKFLQSEAARMLEPMGLSTNGKAPAGQLAVYLKEMK